MNRPQPEQPRDTMPLEIAKRPVVHDTRKLLGRWRCFGSLGRCLLLRRLGMRRFFEDAADGAGAQMEPGSAEDLGDLHFPERRAENLQPLYGITHTIRELVDGLRDLHQSRGSRFVDSPNPGADGLRRHQKFPGSLLVRPTSGGAQFKDRHSLGG